MSDKEPNEGKTSRAALFAFAAVGAVVIAVAIGMSIWSARKEGPATPAPQQQASPATPAPSDGAKPKADNQQASAPAANDKDKAQPAPATADAAPSFDVVRIARDGRTVMAGRAAPGADVIIMDGDKEVGRTKANNNGEWVFTPDQPLAPGNRELSLKAENPGGKEKASDAPVVLIVPERPKSAEDQKNAGDAVAIKIKPGGGVQILQVPTATQGSGPVSIEVVNFNDKGHLSVAGRAAPKSTVQVYLDNEPIGSATADAKGAWTITVDRQLGEGSHTVRADQTGADGKVTARAEISFNVGGGAAASGQVTVATGNSLWRIARKAYGSGFDYITIYKANQDQIRNPDLIYPGQVFKLPTKG